MVAARDLWGYQMTVGDDVGISTDRGSNRPKVPIFVSNLETSRARYEVPTTFAEKDSRRNSIPR